MVSSELVVLLIVCVGINTGSAQQQPGDHITIVVFLVTLVAVHNFMHFPRNHVKMMKQTSAILAVLLIQTSVPMLTLL